MQLQRISFSSHVAIEDPFKWVYKLEDHGYTGWEILQEGSQCLNSKNIQNLKNIYETTGLELTLHLPFSDMNLAGLNNSIRAEVLRQMKHYLTLASNYVNLAVIHPGYLSHYGVQVPQEAYLTNLASIREICDFAADFGILIAVEILEMLDTIGSHNVGFTFDVGHANTVGLVNDFLDLLAEKISHVHIHDNMGKKDEHLSLGRGNINWKFVMERLSDYKGVFVTEMGSVEEGIQSLDYLRNL